MMHDQALGCYVSLPHLDVLVPDLKSIVAQYMCHRVTIEYYTAHKVKQTWTRYIYPTAITCKQLYGAIYERLQLSALHCGMLWYGKRMEINSDKLVSVPVEGAYIQVIQPGDVTFVFVAEYCAPASVGPVIYNYGPPPGDKEYVPTEYEKRTIERFFIQNIHCRVMYGTSFICIPPNISDTIYIPCTLHSL